MKIRRLFGVVMVRASMATYGIESLNAIHKDKMEGSDDLSNK